MIQDGDSELSERISEGVEQSADVINEYSYSLLIELGVSHQYAALFNMIVLAIATALLVFIVHFAAKHVLRSLIWVFRNRFGGNFVEYLRNNRFPHYLALIAPVNVVSVAIPIVFAHYTRLQELAKIALDFYIVFMVVWILMSVAKSIANIIEQDPRYKYRPIQSYLQVVTIILYLLGMVALFSMLTGKSPTTFFGVMGAASAILLLMFKDTIMGFVASIQVTTNDMVRIGDWIEMPKYGADGDVVSMTLTTVKVQNWDKTITMVPTHTLISDSFKNWRGMQEFGGRRVKRALIIKQSSIRYLQDDELPKFAKIAGITDFIQQRKAEIDAHNNRLGLDRSYLLNGRNMTNVGLFRQYATWYISNHPGVHKEKTIMVRQLAPTPQGLPIEIYLFSNDVRWVYYEAIVGDLFDHLIAAVPYFDLKIFEEISDDISTARATDRFALSKADDQTEN